MSMGRLACYAGGIGGNAQHMDMWNKANGKAPFGAQHLALGKQGQPLTRDLREPLAFENIRKKYLATVLSVLEAINI